MMKKIDAITIVKALHQHELFAFTSRMVGDLFGLSNVQTAQVLRRMETYGFVARVEQGKYLLLGLTPEHVLSDPLFIGSHLVVPSYVSFWSALHSYGFTEQVPRTVFVATTRKKTRLDFRGHRFQFVTLQPRMFFGYRRESLTGLPIVIADEAKAILDSLLFPQYAGGFSEVTKALRNAYENREINVELLVEYANRLASPSLSSRLGYLLEILGEPTGGLMAARGPVNLDPQGPRQGLYHPRWKVYINTSPQQLFPERLA